MAAPALDLDALRDRLLAGERAALARAITLAESKRADHRAAARDLIDAVLPHTGRAIRVGITGVPGVGKSTTIDALGSNLTAAGHKVAVLAVDPSSTRTGGSILGDKTRMQELARDERAFIRPSPTAGTLGGVARRTREAGLACEAAGFDVIVMETVGVGQSETAVADMVDLFVLLLPPAGGDELQGLKKGIVELADLIIVNKADGDLEPAANRAVAEYVAAVHMLRPANAGWMTPVLKVSALYRRGLDKVWQEISRFRTTLGETRLAEKRARQARAWMWNEIEEGLIAALRGHPLVARRLGELEAKVAAGSLTPTAAAKAILEDFRSRG